MTIKELEAKYNELDEKLRGAYALIRELRETVKAQEAAIHNSDIQIHGSYLSNRDAQNQIVAMNKELGRVKDQVEKLKEIVDKHSDTLVGADKELGALRRRIKTLEMRFDTHNVLTSGLYGAHSPTESTCTSEENDVKEALFTLSKVCREHSCYTCPFRGDKPIASRCELITTAPCAYEGIMEEPK